MTSFEGNKEATLALRNPSESTQKFDITLREALDIPAYIKGSVTLSDAFSQSALPGLVTGGAIDIDAPLSLELPPLSVFVYDGVCK